NGNSSAEQSPKMLGQASAESYPCLTQSSQSVTNCQPHFGHRPATPPQPVGPLVPPPVSNAAPCALQFPPPDHDTVRALISMARSTTSVVGRSSPLKSERCLKQAHSPVSPRRIEPQHAASLRRLLANDASQTAQISRHSVPPLHTPARAGTHPSFLPDRP